MYYWLIYTKIQVGTHYSLVSTTVVCRVCRVCRVCTYSEPTLCIFLLGTFSFLFPPFLSGLRWSRAQPDRLHLYFCGLGLTNSYLKIELVWGTRTGLRLYIHHTLLYSASPMYIYARYTYIQGWYCITLNLLRGCDVMWCDVMWCDAVWCGVVWCGVVWCDVIYMIWYRWTYPSIYTGGLLLFY